MIFWRKKNNIKEQEREEQDERLLRRKADPAIEPSTDYEAEISPELKHDLRETETEIIEELKTAPVPEHTQVDDAEEDEELRDHSDEGGWLSRLSSGLSKSSRKITQGFTDILTKKKLDQDTLDNLEEILLSADLGPRTASKIIKEFSKDRFGKDIDEQEIRHALADTMADILTPVAKPLDIQKPNDGPFVILVCGVNGVGKTTSIGKLAYSYHFQENKKVVIAAADTFRAAALEQLEEWSKRAKATFIAKDIGADAAAVAFEAYEKAKEENADILFIDTAGRLHNKANLMAELEKIVRVLKKQNDNLPHASLLVLDATTGQNAFSQVETFKESVEITGLIVNKLDGSAKGGVVIGLANQFDIPVHAIGVGEGIEDMQPFLANHFANSLMGITVKENNEDSV